MSECYETGLERAEKEITYLRQQLAFDEAEILHLRQQLAQSDLALRESRANDMESMRQLAEAKKELSDKEFYWAKANAGLCDDIQSLKGFVKVAIDYAQDDSFGDTVRELNDAMRFLEDRAAIAKERS